MTQYLVIAQGRWADVSGAKLADVIAAMHLHTAEFVRQHPSSAAYAQIAGSVQTFNNDAPSKPSFGYERYLVNADGTLGQREANWDSGD